MHGRVIAFSYVLAILASGAALLPPLAWADGSAAATPLKADSAPENATPKEQEIWALVRRLGSGSYADRQRASREIIHYGMQAEPALTASLTDSDAEIRFRANLALSEISKVDFNDRLEAFALDVDDQHDHQIPSWDRYAAVVGRDQTARALFVDMQRSEGPLLAALSKGNQAVGEQFSQRMLAMQQILSWPAANTPQELSVGSIAALLFVGGSPGVELDEQLGSQMYTYLNQTAIETAIRSSAQSPPLRKLVETWLVKDSGPTITYQNLLISLQMDFKVGLELALRVLRKDAGQSQFRQFAILAVGRFGSKEHLAVLEPLLKDTTPCGSQKLGDREMQSQVCDIALAAMIHLAGQSIKDYGFEQAQPSTQFLYQPGTVGFFSAKARLSAMKKWREQATAPKPAE